MLGSADAARHSGQWLPPASGRGSAEQTATVSSRRMKRSRGSSKSRWRPLLDPATFAWRPMMRGNLSLDVPAFVTHDGVIWGATAMVLAEFLTLIGWSAPKSRRSDFVQIVHVSDITHSAFRKIYDERRALFRCRLCTTVGIMHKSNGSGVSARIEFARLHCSRSNHSSQNGNLIKGDAMGSAVLGEAISAIRDWSVTKGKEPVAGRASESFGSLVFNDAEQQKRLPKAALPRAAAYDHAR